MTRHPWNDRRSKKKSKSKKRRDEFPEDRPPPQAESLESLLDVMLHVLLVSTCPLCSSSGRVPADKATVDGMPATQGWSVCACRRQAWGLLAEFQLGPAAEVEESDDGDGDEHRGDEDFEEVER